MCVQMQSVYHSSESISQVVPNIWKLILSELK